MSRFPPLPRDSGAELPELERAALLLDLDGTLLDIAPAPDLVVVEAGLTELLRQLRNRLGNALAIVSGRRIEQVEALMPGVAYAIAGEHGGAIRHRPGGEVYRPPVPELPQAWIEDAERFAAMHPGVLVEPKRHGFTVHFRAAPEHGEAMWKELHRLVGAAAERFEVMPARKAWEVRPRGIDKGTAVAELMCHPPFDGRRPVFIGDDVTDEDGIRAARARGGIGLRVAESFGEPAAVRAWLARSCEAR